MNLNELHERLTRLSDSERAYQAGFRFDGWEALPKVKIDGREVYRLQDPPKDALSGHGELLSSANNLSLLLAEERFAIKRNSRFNPVPEHIHSYIELNYVYAGQCPQVVYESDLTQEEAFSTNPIVGILRYIEQNFATCTQASVAEQFHISQNYVSTLLKKHTGKTYIQTVQAQKLKYAANLLKNTDRPITEIASEAGYENGSFFYKKFQKQFGCSPGEFRER